MMQSLSADWWLIFVGGICSGVWVAFAYLKKKNLSANSIMGSLFASGQNKGLGAGLIIILAPQLMLYGAEITAQLCVGQTVIAVVDKVVTLGDEKPVSKLYDACCKFTYEYADSQGMRHYGSDSVWQSENYPDLLTKGHIKISYIPSLPFLSRAYDFQDEFNNLKTLCVGIFAGLFIHVWVTRASKKSNL